MTDENLTTFGIVVLTILIFILFLKLKELTELYRQQRRMNALHDEVMELCDSQERRNIEDIIYLPGPK